MKSVKLLRSLSSSLPFVFAAEKDLFPIEMNISLKDEKKFHIYPSSFRDTEEAYEFLKKISKMNNKNPQKIHFIVHEADKLDK